MFSNLGEMAKLMQKAKEMKNNVARLKEELANSEYSAAAPGGQVVAVATGDFRLKRITVLPAATVDQELLEEQILAAVNNAMDAAKKAAQSKMSELTGGLNLPGLF